jgi:hypothetical protein
LLGETHLLYADSTTTDWCFLATALHTLHTVSQASCLNCHCNSVFVKSTLRYLNHITIIDKTYKTKCARLTLWYYGI